MVWLHEIWKVYSVWLQAEVDDTYTVVIFSVCDGINTVMVVQSVFVFVRCSAGN